MGQLEVQIVQALGGLLLAVATTAVGVLVPAGKKWLHAHASEKVANAGDTLLTGLGTIVENVVGDINQTVVHDVKGTPAWTPQLKVKIKNDAIAAVKSQGAALIALGEKVIGNMDPLIESFIQAEVDRQKQQPKLLASTS